MRRNRSSFSLALIVIVISGCASSQPERVYVDIDRVLASERAPDLTLAPLPQPRPPARPVSVKQPGLPATTVTDKTISRLQLAKRLIAENRGKSIASLSTMLKRLYVAQAEDEIAKRSREGLPGRETILSAVVEQI